jgi:hypothetical protein
MSRARHDTRLYVTRQRPNTPEPEDSHARQPEGQDPRQALHRALSLSKAQHLAGSGLER